MNSGTLYSGTLKTVNWYLDQWYVPTDVSDEEDGEPEEQSSEGKAAVQEGQIAYSPSLVTWQDLEDIRII